MGDVTAKKRSTSIPAIITRPKDRLERTLGGPARLRVVLLLAAVLSLTTAAMSTIGATAPQLEMALHINTTDIGLLVTASNGIGVLTTLPFGAAADRVRRVRLLLVRPSLHAVGTTSSPHPGVCRRTTRVAPGAHVLYRGA